MSDISDLMGKVKVGEWLNGMYSKNISDQKSELKALFTKIQDTGLSESEKAALTESKTSLQATVDKLEAELAILEEKMSSTQDEIDALSNQVASLLSTIKTQTDSIEVEQKKYAQNVVNDVLNKRKRNPDYGVDAMVADMFKGMKKFESNSNYQNLQSNLDLLDGKESKIKTLVDSASKLIDSKNILEKRYGVTKSTYDLISENISAAVMKNGSFTNKDLGVEKPIFSATKLEAIVPYFDSTSINVTAGENNNYQEGSTSPNPTLKSISEKYKKYLNTNATSGVDAYSIKNAAVVNLGKAIDKGMLTDLRLAGITGDKLTEFLTTNFAGAKITKESNGTLKIPYGHGTDARGIYKKLTDFVSSQNLGNDSSKWSSDHFKGVVNTWDKNKGNTISSNNQIKVLSENFATIADKMKTSGFTFKEAMYAMFNQDNGLFKDSGIIYDLTKQEDGLKYFIEYAGDDETASAYKEVASIIYKNWGVKPTMCIDYDNIDNENIPDDSDNTPNTPTRTDPLSFVKGDSEYTFVIDRDSDGRFDGVEEFIGGATSKSWLDDLKSLDSDGNGIIENDELKNLKILKSKIKDNEEVTKNGNAQTETTNIDYEFTNAKDLGIESINLNDLENNVNNKANRTDVNNSEVFNDSFKFNLNGEEITAKRKDDTEEYMKTVYGNAFGTKLDNKAGLTDAEIDKIISDDYGEFDKLNDKFGNFQNKLDILNAYENSSEEMDKYVEKVKTQSDNENRAIISRGQNKAEAMYGKSGNWDQIQDQVIKIAKERGIDVDSGDFKVQAQGIYINSGNTLSPSEIVDEYAEKREAIDIASERRENSALAFNAMLECAKNGIGAKLDDIMELITSGKAKTVEDILNHYKSGEDEVLG